MAVGGRFVFVRMVVFFEAGGVARSDFGNLVSALVDLSFQGDANVCIRSGWCWRRCGKGQTVDEDCSSSQEGPWSVGDDLVVKRAISVSLRTKSEGAPARQTEFLQNHFMDTHSSLSSVCEALASVSFIMMPKVRKSKPSRLAF